MVPLFFCSKFQIWMCTIRRAFWNCRILANPELRFYCGSVALEDKTYQFTTLQRPLLTHPVSITRYIVPVFNSGNRSLPSSLLKAPIEFAYLTGWRIKSEVFPLLRRHQRMLGFSIAANMAIPEIQVNERGVPYFPESCRAA
jgi:hypothetical protein